MPRNNIYLRSSQQHNEKAQRALVLAEKQLGQQAGIAELVHAMREQINSTADLLEHLKNNINQQ